MAFTRYIQGDTHALTVPVATGQSTDVGTPVGIANDGTLVKPSDIAWDTDLATTQTAFAGVFAGRSDQKKIVGIVRVYGNSEDNKLGISTTGEFEATLQSAASTIAGVTYLGAAKHASNNALIDDVLVVVATAARAIAVCTQTVTNKTKVMCQLLSARFPVSK